MILEFGQPKSDMVPSIIHTELESLIEKEDGCTIILKNHPQQKQVNVFHLTYSLSSFKSIKNKQDVYRGKDCMKKFCKILKRARNGES